ncbi:MAG: glycosyltransferase [Bacteroidales bacterium]|nr:glycosyltransferase [Bacteroidales bacterium]
MNKTSQQPLVSIQCLVYNHEPYLRQCLDGFVMQKANFKFEAIVHDDVSTDRSAEIIREYAEKYPDIIKPIFEKENQFSKGFDKLSSIMNAAGKGKYIALCEGDDYWTDPLKLQKQVDFMEAHPDYAMCFSDAVVTWEDDKGIIPRSGFFNVETREYTGQDLLRNWVVPTASVLYRNYYQEGLSPPTDKRFIYADIVTFLWLASLGKVWCDAEKRVVYRRHPGSVSMKRVSVAAWIHHHEALNEHFGPTYDSTIFTLIREYYRMCLLSRSRIVEAMSYLLKHDLRRLFPTLAYLVYRFVKK